MTADEPDGKDFDWTEVEPSVATELLNRAKRYSQRMAEDTEHKLGLDDRTDMCPVVW